MLSKTLTPKQRTFAQHVASGKMSLSDAYRAAYNAAKMSGPAIRNEASKLMTHPDVAMMVEGLQRQKERAVIAVAISDRERVLTMLRELLDTAQPSDMPRLRAAELLGKSVGLFKDVVEQKTQRSAEEIEAELEERLAALVGEDSDPDASVH